MQNVLTDAERFIKFDSRFVRRICLDVDHPRTYLSRLFAQSIDQAGRDALAPIARQHGKIVNIDLAAFPFKFLQNIRRQATNDPPLNHGNDRDESIAVKKRT